MTGNVELIKGGYAAFARGDIAATLALFAPDMTWDTPASVPGGGVYRGPQEIGGWFAGLSERWAELRVEPEQFLDAGNHVVVLGRHRGSARGTGTAIDIAFAHVWSVRDGMATSLTEYLDSAVLAAAFGAAPATV
jgi:ketosteroid isomerase-like protein